MRSSPRFPQLFHSASAARFGAAPRSPEGVDPARQHIVHTNVFARIGVGENLCDAASPERNTAEVGNMALGSKAQAVEMLMMTPDFCFCITGTTSRVGRMTFMR